MNPLSFRKYLTYSLIRCSDEQRDEALNVGVLVLDPASRAVAVRITEDLSRIRRTLPNVGSSLGVYLKGLPAFFVEHASEMTPEALAKLAAEWGNGVRLSTPRSIAAEEMEATAAQLFARYVDMPEPAELTVAEVPTVQSASSWRTAKAVMSRLRKRGFEDGRDFQADAKVVGRTVKQTEVPVWFPLLVGRRLLVDSMEVRPRDERRTVDNARLIAAKADEVFRADKHSVTVILRRAETNHLNDLVRSLVLEEGAVGARIPTVYWHDEMDDFVASIPRAQLDLPTNGTDGKRKTSMAQGASPLLARTPPPRRARTEPHPGAAVDAGSRLRGGRGVGA